MSINNYSIKSMKIFLLKVRLIVLSVDVILGFG